MQETIFSRCPVGTATEYVMRTGELEKTLNKIGFTYKILQQMDPKYQPSHFLQTEPLHFRDGGNIPPIWAQSMEERSVLLGVTYQHEIRGIFVKADSEIKSIEDLKGRKLSVPVRNKIPVDFQKYTALCGVENILAKHEMTLDDIDKIEIECAAFAIKQSDSMNVMKREFDDVTGEFQALLDGKADFAYANSVKVIRLMDDPRFRNIVPETEQYETGEDLNNNNPILITCTKKFAIEHRDVVETYLALLMDAAEKIKNDQDNFIRIAGEGAYESTYDEMKKAYAEDLCFIRKPSLEAEDIKAVKRRAESLHKMGCIQQVPDIEKWADRSYIKNIQL